MAKVYDFRDPINDYSDHSGEVYGKLTILRLEDSNKEGKRRYEVRCNVCGKILHGLTITDVKIRAFTKCIHPRMGKYKANWSHGKLRQKYTAMIERCYNPQSTGYYNYGARGITICDEWLKSPQAFNDWAINNGYEEGLSIDRIDNYKGYCPENCRWVTNRFNAVHRRAVVYMTIDGVENTLADWSRLFGYARSFFNDYYDRHGREATKKFIKEHIKAKRRLISERHRYKFNVNGCNMTVDEVTKYLGLKKTHLSHYIQSNGIDEARSHVAKLVKDHDKDTLIIKFGGE